MRRSTRASVLDDRSFAVRCRIEVPSGGLKCYDEFHRWLRLRLGRDGYATHGAPFDFSGRQSFYLHANDPKAVADCVEAFGLKVLALEKQSPGNTPTASR